MKYVIIFGLVALTTFVSGRTPCMGCAREVKGSDLKPLEEILKEALNKLATGDGPSYEFVKINYATSQVVAGRLYKVNADMKDKNGEPKTCNFDILLKPGMKLEREVTARCPGEERVVKTYSL